MDWISRNFEKCSVTFLSQFSSNDSNAPFGIGEDWRDMPHSSVFIRWRIEWKDGGDSTPLSCWCWSRGLVAVSLQVKDRLPDAVKQREGLRKHYITILYKFFETWQLVVGSNWVESQNFLSRMWLLLAWECTTLYHCGFGRKTHGYYKRSKTWEPFALEPLDISDSQFGTSRLPDSASFARCSKVFSEA